VLYPGLLRVANGVTMKTKGQFQPVRTWANRGSVCTTRVIAHPTPATELVRQGARRVMSAEWA